MKKLGVVLISVLGGLLIVSVGASVYAQDCKQFYGKGYCTDYIKERTGKQQSGDAKDWKSNIKKDDVKKGDVAIFDFGKWGHVAYVEKVNHNKKGKPESVDISEKNWGSPLDDCARGPEFGKKTNRKDVSLSRVSRFWHP
jgi:surface antigen